MAVGPGLETTPQSSSGYNNLTPGTLPGGIYPTGLVPCTSDFKPYILQLWSTTIIYALNVQARLGGDTYVLYCRLISTSLPIISERVTLLTHLVARHRPSLRFSGESYVAGVKTGLYS